MISCSLIRLRDNITNSLKYYKKLLTTVIYDTSCTRPKNVTPTHDNYIYDLPN